MGYKVFDKSERFDSTFVGIDNYRNVLLSGAFSLINSDFAMLGVILIFIWKNAGYNLIIYLAGLAQMDRTIIDASKNRWCRIYSKAMASNYADVYANYGICGDCNHNQFIKVFKDVYVLQSSVCSNYFYRRTSLILP